MPVPYNVIVSRCRDNDSEVSADVACQPIQRDDLDAIVERVRGQGFVPKDEATKFVTGPKRFGEILLRNRRDSVVADRFPHFRQLMKEMKASVAKGFDV